MKKNFTSLFYGLLFLSVSSWAQIDTTVYTLTLREETVNKAGKEVRGMTVNGTIPGPTLHFKEGDYAIIYVQNEMDVESSVHWHGLLLPNYFDGVPYLTTPPIMPGETFKYEFPLIQSGTYWYHSHTMLQEQSGVYGSIIIEPKEQRHTYDHDQVLVLSDWTNEKPENVLRNLKRGNEWYNIKKGTSTPLNRVIARGAFGAQMNFWRQRMESADIADIYYPTFLTNGQPSQHYTQYQPGEKVRLRIINAAASSQFWITFGGDKPSLISADGQDVVPIEKEKLFIGIAETYDVLITIPASGKIEMRAMAQDGSGITTAYFGKGETLPAEVLDRPDQIQMMKQMAGMDMRMGAPAMKFLHSKEEPQKMMQDWGMDMSPEMGSMGHPSNPEQQEGDHRPKGQHMEHNMEHQDHKEVEEVDTHDHVSQDAHTGADTKMQHGGMFAEYNYDDLRAVEKTRFDEEKRPVNNILLNLTGNMWRYIWSMNGVPIHEADKIQIKKGEIARITFNNLTMMHHPMHLHGHFFRVVNKQGDYSPLKHTVNVAPMQMVTIEFYANESHDWFLHCHVLYHMMAGMARVVSYGTDRDERLMKHPLKILINEGNHFYTWGLAEVASHMTEFNLISSNIRNQFNINGELGYNENLEAEVTYERYLSDYFRVFVGVNMENEIEDSLDDIEVTTVGGIRFFTPYMFDLDLRIDHQLRPEIRLSREMMIFPRTVIFGNYEYQVDFGWANTLTTETSQEVDYTDETTWSVGLEYFLSRNFSLMASYDNRFGGGGGLSIRF